MAIGVLIVYSKCMTDKETVLVEGFHQQIKAWLKADIELCDYLYDLERDFNQQINKIRAHIHRYTRMRHGLKRILQQMIEEKKDVS